MIKKKIFIVIVCALAVSSLAQMAVKVNRALVPTTGNFYLLSQSGTPMPPLPFDPYPGCTVYSLGDNRFAIDDRVVAAARQALRETSAADEPGIPGEGGSTDGVFLPMDTSYLTNGSLWIEIGQRFRTSSCSRIFRAFAIIRSESSEIVLQPFSNKEINTTDRPVFSASFSWVSFARWRPARILSPKTRRCSGTEGTMQESKCPPALPFTIV